MMRLARCELVNRVAVEEYVRPRHAGIDHIRVPRRLGVIPLRERQLARYLEVVAAAARDQTHHVNGGAVLDRHPLRVAQHVRQRMLQVLASHLAHPGVLDAVERGEYRGMVLVCEKNAWEREVTSQHL